MLDFVDIGGCPVPTEYGVDIAFRHVVARTGAYPTTAYRGSAYKKATAIMHAHGKHTQGELVHASPAERAAWGIRGTPNPEGGSTHDLHSDGVAFAGPPGRPIPAYQLGSDWPPEKVPEVIAAFNELGCHARRPYPWSSNETQHVCCDKPPKITPELRLTYGPLKPGEHGEIVKSVQVLMKRAGLWDGKIADKAGTYGHELVHAVKRFQERTQGLKPDGIVGPATFRLMNKQYGWRRWLRLHPIRPKH